MRFMMIITIIQPIVYVDYKGDLLILIVRMHQHNTNSTILQAAISLKENYREADK
jgi:hypothetical protein